MTSRLFLTRTPDQPAELLIRNQDGLIQLPLTRWIVELSQGLSDKTVWDYASTVVRWINFSWSMNPERLRFWQEDEGVVRSFTCEYLSRNFKSATRRNRNGEGIYIVVEKRQRSSVRVLLSALTNLYDYFIKSEGYQFDSPFRIKFKLNDGDAINHYGRGLPFIADPLNFYDRPTDHYFILCKNTWQPEPVLDPLLFHKFINGTAHPSWGIRELVLAYLLFSSGGRISECCSLTFSGWFQGSRFGNGAYVITKGSLGVKTKYIQWFPEVTELIWHYIINVRRPTPNEPKFDFQKFINARTNSICEQLDFPIFTTTRGNAVSPNLYRGYYWRKQCESAGLYVRPHQVRHNVVSVVYKDIMDGPDPAEIKDMKLDAVVQYMDWKSGRKMLDVYAHTHRKKEQEFDMVELLRGLAAGKVPPHFVPAPEIRKTNLNKWKNIE